MKKHLFFFVPILLSALSTSCQNMPDAATAEKMVRDANAKFQQQPYQFMQENASADFVFINGEGGSVNKEQMLEIAKAVKISKWDLENLQVRALDNVLVATGINNHVVGGDDGNSTTYKTAFTYVYQVKGGKLESVLMQHTHVQNEAGKK